MDDPRQVSARGADGEDLAQGQLAGGRVDGVPLDGDHLRAGDPADAADDRPQDRPHDGFAEDFAPVAEAFARRKKPERK